MAVISLLRAEEGAGRYANSKDVPDAKGGTIVEGDAVQHASVDTLVGRIKKGPARQRVAEREKRSLSYGLGNILAKT